MIVLPPSGDFRVSFASSGRFSSLHRGRESRLVRVRVGETVVGHSGEGGPATERTNHRGVRVM